MQNLLIIGGIVLAVAFIHSAARGTSGMEDTLVSIENIRKGVERGWYNAVLCRVNGKPAVFLFGKNADGGDYGGYYPISETDWQTLKSEGYKVK